MNRTLHNYSDRGVVIGQNATGTVIITGDDNFISLNCQNAFAFHLLDDDFRAQQSNRDPATFYDGRRPNWANIARKDDAPRNLFEDIQQFVTNPELPGQRMALILGLSGEGKTTLLMRLAWALAESGYPVLWRHSGRVFNRSNYDFRFEYDRPLILCFDQVDEEADLPILTRELVEHGIHFIILATAQHHAWHNAEMDSFLRRHLYLKGFPLGKLTEKEVNDLLDCLAAANKLDALEKLSRSQQVRLFMDRLRADGQLLPALLTIRYGAHDFEEIIESLLLKLRQRRDENFLFNAYINLSSIHRFGYGLSPSLLASMLDISEDEIRIRVQGPLDKELELLEVTESDERLYTRHPLIADKAFKISLKRYWIDPHSIYIKFIQAIAETLRSNTFQIRHRELLTSFIRKLKNDTAVIIDKILNKIDAVVIDDSTFWEIWGIVARTTGEAEKARVFFQKALKFTSKRAPILQAWGVMESRLGKYEEARHLFEQAIQFDSNHAPSWQAWAIMERNLDNIKEARELFQRGMEADPTDAYIWPPWALMEKEQGNIERARELFQRGTEANPTDAYVWGAWASMEKEQGDIESARKFFQRRTEIDPTNAAVWYAWAIMENQQGSIKKARELFLRGTEADPTNKFIWHAWAIIEKEQGNIEKARELFQCSTEADHTDAPSWQAWALMEKEQGEIERARELFQRGIEADPTHAVVWQAWALMEKGQGDIERARELFQRGTEVDPTQAAVWQAWALMEKGQGDIKRARELFQRGTEADPTHAYSWQAWALMEKEQRNIERARELFQRGTEANPTHAPVWQAWALMEKEQGNIERARELFQRGTEADPTHGAVWQAWALMENGQGDIERSRELFQRGTEANPTHAPVWQAWALMEKKQGNIERARKLFEKGRKANPMDILLWLASARLELEESDALRTLELLDEAMKTIRVPYEQAQLLVISGRALASLHCLEDAEETFREALQLQENSTHCHYFFAACVLEPQGRLDEARSHYHRALELAPRNPKERENLERALNRLKCL